MIAKLKGILDASGPNWVVLDVNGVGYLVYCSAKTILHLKDQGHVYTLFTETIVREDLFNLYGFADEEERDMFRILTTVQGVGMKAALAILSIAEPHQLQEAIARQDQSFLTRADGIGPKLATRIVHELKDKIGLPSRNSNVINLTTTEHQSSQEQDAVSALLNLGYKPLEANQAVAFAKQQPHKTVEELIRTSLNRLSQARG